MGRMYTFKADDIEEVTPKTALKTLIKYSHSNYDIYKTLLYNKEVLKNHHGYKPDRTCNIHYNIASNILIRIKAEGKFYFNNKLCRIKEHKPITECIIIDDKKYLLEY